MSKKGKVLVAMSGGIDSTVIALMLHDEGYEAVALLWRHGTMRRVLVAKNKPVAATWIHSTMHDKQRLNMALLIIFLIAMKGFAIFYPRLAVFKKITIDER